MEKQQTTGIRKRQQITKANRTMFLWVAAASVVVGFSLVVAIFLWQKIAFSEKVITEKSKTLSNLTDNLAAVPSLRDNVRLLDTNDDLKATRLKDTDRPIQSVLDALPADANSTALGSSLQSKLLTGVNGVTLDAIKVDPVAGVETPADAGAVSSTSAGDNTISFSFTVSVASNNPDALRSVLLQLERSIRAIDVTSLTVEQQGSRLVMTATGHAYYQPAVTIQLQDKVVRP
jgi:hypothetical protein